MASAYSLLPSAAFFGRLFGPTIAFASTTLPNLNDGSYPKEITDASNQAAFLGDSHAIRSSPDFNDTVHPIVGNNTLLEAARTIHDVIDPWSWPASIARWAIIGSGLDTTRSILYKLVTTCKFGLIGLWCGQGIGHDTRTTVKGDGTVVGGSAAYNSGTPVSVDLKADSALEGATLKHANILESSTTQAIVRSILTNSDASVQTHSLEYLPAVHLGSADPGSVPYELRISTHSPVELHVYDEFGNHTGPIHASEVALPSASTSASTSDMYYEAAYESKIPGSDYRTNENSDGRDTTITLPHNGGIYRIEVLGTDLGFATLDIEKVREGDTVDSVEYSMFPVTPLSEATTTLSSRVLDEIDPPSIASSTPPLSIDLDGDAKAEITQTPNSGALPSQESVIQTLTILANSLAANDPHAVQIQQRLDHIQDLIDKGKFKQVNKQSSSFETHLGHIPLKDLNADQRKQLLDTIDSIVLEAERGQE